MSQVIKMIKSRLLNRTLNVFRVGLTVDASGDSANTETMAGTMAGRITDYKPSADNGKEYGMFISATHIIFCNPPAFDIYPGNYIYHGLDKYKVNFVHKTAGGELNHHWEILATLVEP